MGRMINWCTAKSQILFHLEQIVIVKKYQTFTCLKSIFPSTRLMLFTMTLASSDLRLVGCKFARLRDPTVSVMLLIVDLRAPAVGKAQIQNKTATSQNVCDQKEKDKVLKKKD